MVGTGAIGSRHADTIAGCPGTVLAGVVDSDPDARTAFEAGGAEAFPTVDGLLNALGGGGLDGVVVATTTDAHLECAEPLIDAGLPVLVEKPIAATMEEAARIAQLSNDAEVPVLVGHHRRFHNQVRTAQLLVESGVLGELVLVSAVWSLKKHPDYYVQPVRKTRAAGPVMINLVHDIDMLRFICGEIEAVSAQLTNRFGGSTKEDAGIVSLRFESGALGSIALSDRANSPWAWEYSSGESRLVPRIGENCVRFIGTSRALDFPNLVLWSHECNNGDWTTPMNGHPVECEWIDPYEVQLQHFLEVIRGTENPLTDAEDAGRSLGATLAIFESADSGGWVEP